jgi:hypothetical protein
MIERIAIEALIGVIAICTVVPLALRHVLRTRREVREIVAEERGEPKAFPSTRVVAARPQALPEDSSGDDPTTR